MSAPTRLAEVRHPPIPRGRRPLRRPRRWMERAAWMAQHMAADIGLRGATRHGPLWLHDNPFFRKTLRAESGRLSFALRIFFTVLVLSGILLGLLALRHAYPFGFRIFVQLTHLPVPILFFLVISSVHAILVLGTRGTLAASLPTEARRQTLDGLLLTPARRAEMLLAMGVGPAVGAMLVGLVGLPLYIFLHQIGGVEWPEIILLYLLFALLSYAPPVYAVPALSGAAATPDAPPIFPGNRAQERRQNGAGAAGVTPLLILVWFFVVVGRWVFSFRGAWVGHLYAALPPSLGAFGPLSLLA